MTALAFASTLVAQDLRAEGAAFCNTLSAVLASAPDKFESLRTEQFDNRLESFAANLQVPGFEACYVDGIRPAFFCLRRGLSDSEAEALAAEITMRIARCFPEPQPTTARDPRSPVPRIVTTWSLPEGRLIRLVRRDYAEHPGSVYLHIH
ncbi:MAG TPA: hypothetical protein VF342_08885 [Alphaproteobacteria bacterium]